MSSNGGRARGVCCWSRPRAPAGAPCCSRGAHAVPRNWRSLRDTRPVVSQRDGGCCSRDVLLLPGHSHVISSAAASPREQVQNHSPSSAPLPLFLSCCCAAHPTPTRFNSGNNLWLRICDVPRSAISGCASLRINSTLQSGEQTNPLFTPGLRFSVSYPPSDS